MMIVLLRYLAILVAVLLIPISWFLLRAGDPETLPDFAVESQRKSAIESCLPTSPCELELPELLKMADVFHGTYIKTHGVLLLEFESNSLFENVYDYSEFSYRRGVALRVASEVEAVAPPNQSWVDVVGRFVAEGKNDGSPADRHTGMFPGRVDVEQITESGN